jgi:hypothetical protein
MAQGKHYGAFAGGFAKSITEMMKLYLMQQHYDALNKHYAAQEELWANRGLGKNKGLSPGTIAAGGQAGRDWCAGRIGSRGAALSGTIRSSGVGSVSPSDFTRCGWVHAALHLRRCGLTFRKSRRNSNPGE